MADPYRDETASLRRRIESLEEELSAAHERIALLEGRGPEGAGLAPRLLGAPTSIEVRGRTDRSVEGVDQERMLEILRTRIGGSWQTARSGGTFHAALYDARQQRNVELSVRPVEGGSEIRFQERLGALAGGLFGGIVGGAGGGGLGVILPLAILAGLGAWTVFIAFAWVAAVYAIVRMGYRGAVARRRRALQLGIDDIIESFAARARNAEGGVRIAGADRDASNHGASEAEGEHQAETEAEDERPRVRSARPKRQEL